MTDTKNVQCKFYLGNELFCAFCLFVVRKGDKSKLVSNILNDFLNNNCSIYEVLNLEDTCIRKHGRDEDFSKLEDGGLHVCINEDLYSSYISKCNEYGVSSMVLGRALILHYVNNELIKNLTV